ncbi:Xaa-Pro peptidase family protein [Octadecabacter sp. G9-8]|uniref:Xaa-Pro peptidase family protein n=1 Tax=Octadecabacter dasysiphoniae TaxID=2909341 RepID=A0ABS9CYL0_9RHOB|nr:Xaa-Pro peptidase family protein [Octadecabacter dasysiphoniae]MCF2872333.1 Xaa-Pro peptidase family protein [Octadecabacter dasysiphoniae]
MTLTSISRGFPEAEFVARTARAQTSMAHVGLDGILLMTEAEVQYFTGFQTLFWQSPTRPWFVYIPASGKPIAIIPEIGASLMQRSWLDDIRTWAAPAPDDDGISLLTDLLLSQSVVGVMKGHETQLRMPLGDWERLMAALPALEFKDATGLVQGLRMVKSEAEIEKIEHICAIGSETFAQVPQFARAGVPLDDVFREFRREALAQGADGAPYLVGASSQGGYADVISPPDTTPLTHGDVLMLDTGLVWDGYHCDFDRNWAIGKAHDAAKQAYDVLWRATQAGIEAARPGNTCRDLFDVMSRIIATLDDSGGDIGRLGHGLGLQLTEQPSHAAFDTTQLTENMVLTLEPSLSYGDGLMMVHEENIVVTQQGGRLLSTRAAVELPVI